MGTVTIREHAGMARGRTGEPTGLLKAEILAKQSITTSADGSVDSSRVSAKTHFIAIETDADVRYRIRPKSAIFTPLAATGNDTPVPAGSVAIEAVYPGAIIAFLQTSQIGGGHYPFQQSYVPVLAL